MSLMITFVALAATFGVLLYAIAIVLQGYLYNQPASRLPLRAVAGGLVATAFITFWVYANTRADSKDKYGTLFEFNSTASQPMDEFTAIRRHVGAEARESTVKYRKSGANFVEERDTGKPFKLTTSDWLVTAVEVPQKDGKLRFEAELFVPVAGKPGEQKPWKPGDPGQPTYSRESVRVFREAGGNRYIEFTQLGSPGSIQVPNRGAWFGAFVLNLLHFVVWFIVFWPILRFTSGTALGLAAGFTLTIMLFVMPILFERNKPPIPVGVASCFRESAA